MAMNCSPVSPKPQRVNGARSRRRRPGVASFHVDVETLPRDGGAYVLLIAIVSPVGISLPKRPDVQLAPGQYLYCGSAYGPGGIRARVARHFRKDKLVRWHVDRLTVAGRTLGAWVFPGGDECALVEILNEFPAAMPGFGASDCRRCASHLLVGPRDLAQAVWPRFLQSPKGMEG